MAEHPLVAGNLKYVFPSSLGLGSLVTDIAVQPYLKRRKLAWTHFGPRLERYSYKYSTFFPSDSVSVARAKDIITGSRFWLASPEAFNDPFDSKVCVMEETSATIKRQKFDRLIRQFRPQLGGIARKREINAWMSNPTHEWLAIAKKLIESQIAALGVTCLSDDPRNLLLWSHYAKDHSGICYQFETINDLNVFARALLVVYTKAYPTINFFTYQPPDITNVLLSKYEDWKYERERRIIAPDGAAKFLSFNPSALTGIIFGTRTTSDSESAIRKLLLEREKLGLPKVELFKAAQHSREYQLTVHRLNRNSGK